MMKKRMSVMLTYGLAGEKMRWCRRRWGADDEFETVASGSAFGVSVVAWDVTGEDGENARRAEMRVMVRVRRKPRPMKVVPAMERLPA